MDQQALVSFSKDLLARRWGEVGPFLTELLAKTTFEELDTVRIGSSSAYSLWAKALLGTGLYKSSLKGKHLFLRIIRELWMAAETEERWTLLRCVAHLYGMVPPQGMSHLDCAAYLNGLADFVGIARERMLHTLLKGEPTEAFANSAPVMASILQ